MARLTKEQKAKLKEEAEKRQAELARKKEIHDEILSVIIIAIGVFLAVSLHTVSTGAVGKFVQQLLFGLFGRMGYVLPYYLIIYGILNFAQKTSYISWRSVLFCSILFILISTINATVFFPVLREISFEPLKAAFLEGKANGGAVGLTVYTLLSRFVGKIGIYIICAAGILICLVFIINTPISAMFDKIRIKAQARRAAAAEAMASFEAEGEQIGFNEIQSEIEQKAKLDEIRSIEAAKEAVDTDRASADDTMKLPSLNLFGNKNEPEQGAFDDGSSFGEDQSGDSGRLEELSDQTSDIEPEIVYDTSDNKQNILSMVTDEGLFASGPSEKIPGYGLDGAEAVSSGRGLDDDDADISAPASADRNEQGSKLFPDEGYSVRREGAAYRFPPLKLLNKPKSAGKSSVSDLTAQAELLEEALSSFGVNASVIDVTRGPSVTRFEVQPAPGVKVSSISKLHDDIMLHLRAKSLRIEAPIPGKAAVGIEVSNEAISMVSLREILESDEFSSAKSRISMGIGKNIAGTPIVVDLKEMPHLLIAGSTGSGKSVCINSIIMSFIYKAKPEEVKLILIDPKVVELSVYNGIPHLLIPVVTEPGKAAAALGWAVTEMDERYRKFERQNVRDISSYNETVLADGEGEKSLPQIVIIIDEMADLMAAAQNQIESYINRLAAKARAAGIHLIFATQHPSVNVISGTIKANFPSRIALSVSSLMDSRVILDEPGAENLLGKGDMLYSPQSLPKPMRVQGCFVSDDEIGKVIEFVKKNSGLAKYSDSVSEALSKTGVSANRDGEDDELFGEAAEFVASAGQASVSSLQRRFRIGYNRAARLIDDMEAKGIVGPADGSHPRKVLISAAELESNEDIS